MSTTRAARGNLVDLSWIKVPRIPLGLIYVVGLLPAAYDYYLGINDQLGADPVKTLERLMGSWSLWFLIATLLVTPLRHLANLNLMRYRRQLGLLAFFYALFHLTVFIWLDLALNFNALIADIVKRPFITIGMLAFAVLVPIAVTSNNASIKKLGAAGWNKLHRWVYLAAALVPLHYIMLVKTWQPKPLMYAAIMALLLGYRWYRKA